MSDETLFHQALVREQLLLGRRQDQRGYIERGNLWGVLSEYLLLPGLRGFWPMSAIDSSGNAQDVSGHGHHLTYNGDPTYNVAGLVPYIDLDGTGDYLSRTDEADLDITGAESYMAIPGLTVGAWVYPEDDANLDGLICKWPSTAGNRSFALFVRGDLAGDPVSFHITDDGINEDYVESASGFTTGAWHFVAGRFDDADSGEELAVWLNGEKTTDTTARASVYSGNADLAIGGISEGTYLLTGNVSLAFLCAAAVPDATINKLFRNTRGLFGV